ncbi:MAG: dTMP kinase [Acidobacteriaceae bacterium]
MQIKQDSTRCKFVSFSGIDGAGKSTQIANLRARLQDAGLRVRLVTFWDDVARLKRIREGAGHTLFKGDKGVGSPDRPINRRDKNVRSWPMSVVRLGLYFVDAISLRIAIGKALRSGVDFVICDRYIYDELANLDLRNPAARGYVRLMMKLVPRPNVSYFLDADPVQARARKPEYPLDFLYISRASYMTLIELVGGMTVIPPMSIQDAERQVMRHALSLLSSEGIQNRPAENLVGER